MFRALVILLLICHFSGRTQTYIGAYYTAIPFSDPIILSNSHLIGVFADFSAKNKFSLRASAFYGTNRYRSTFTTFDAQTNSVTDGKEIVTSFSGREFGLGTCVYYDILKKEKFSLSPGIGAFISFYTKSDVTFGTLYSDTLDGYYRIKPGTHSTKNYHNLRDNLPDIFLVSLHLKLQYSLTKNISFYIEPFVPVFGWYKTYSSFFRCLGASTGLALKLKSKPKPL